jgi:hypothetical protein
MKIKLKKKTKKTYYFQKILFYTHMLQRYILNIHIIIITLNNFQ